MILVWSAVKGMILCDEAIFNGWSYLVFWGDFTDAYFVRIRNFEQSYLDNTKEYEEKYWSRDRENCLKWCEEHARKHMTFYQRIKYRFTKSIIK